MAARRLRRSGDLFIGALTLHPTWWPCGGGSGGGGGDEPDDDIDVDGDGAVDSKELRRGVERAGLKISDEQLRAAFKRMDSDRDGRLSFDEFESTLMLLPHGANPEAVFDAFAHRAFVDDPDGFMTMPRDIDTGRRTSLSAHIREGMEE